MKRAGLSANVGAKVQLRSRLRSQRRLCPASLRISRASEISSPARLSMTPERLNTLCHRGGL
jgi:hypothetical protein